MILIPYNFAFKWVSKLGLLHMCEVLVFLPSTIPLPKYHSDQWVVGQWVAQILGYE